MNSRPTYKRVGFATRAPQVRTESDEIADSLFKVPKPTAPLFVKPVIVPSDDDEGIPLPSRSRSKAPSEPKRDRRKPSRSPSLFRCSDDNTADGDVNQSSDDELESVKSKTTQRSGSVFSKLSKGIRKRSPKKKPNSVDYDSMSVTVRKKRGRSKKEDTYDPSKDPELIAFEKELEDLKGYSPKKMNEIDYWREVEENKHREDSSKVSEVIMVNSGRKKLRLSKKERDRLTRDSRKKSTMDNIQEAPESSDWVTESTPETSTPVLNRKKSLFSPKISAIKPLSPLTTTRKPSAKRRHSRAEGQSRSSPEHDNIPLNVIKAQVESRRGLDFSPFEENVLGDIQQSNGKSGNLVQEAAVQHRHSMQPKLPEINQRKTGVAMKYDTADDAQEDFNLPFPVSDLRKTRQSSNADSRPSTSQTFQVPHKLGQPKLSERVLDKIRPSTKQLPLRQLLLKKQAGTSQPEEPQSDPWTDEQEPRRSISQPAEPRQSYATFVSRPSGTGSRLASVIPCTPNSTTVSLPRHRESIGVFSPAVFSQEERATASQIRLHRKSIVVNARKGPFDLILEICSPNKLITTSHILGNDFKDLAKIGEGSYADVYRAIKNGEEVVMKIIPVGGFYQNDERQTTYEEILSEALISKEITVSLLDKDSKTFYAPAFVKTYFVKVAKGPYPVEFSEKHDSYARVNESNALNQHPMAYSEDQQYVIIGLNNGGEALDTYPLVAFNQAKSVFQQVALGLSVAEKRLQFEHRDLHTSNILIHTTSEEMLTFICDGTIYQVPSHGVHVTIIDWTLSRMRKGKQIVYKDLQDDEQIFNGKGDEQFDVYRYMRDENGHNWETFVPKSNVFWLRYLQQKLLKEKNVLTDPDDPASKKDLQNLSRSFRHFQSASDLVARTKMFQNCICKL